MSDDDDEPECPATWEERLALARGRLEPLAARLGGRVTEADEDHVVVEGRVAETGRGFRLLAQVSDEDGLDGELLLRVAVGNPLGPITLIRNGPDDEPTEFHAPFRDALYVAGLDEDRRRDMLDVAARLPPGIPPAVDRYLHRFEDDVAELAVGADEMTVDLGWYYVADDDWAAMTATLADQLRALDAIAALFESAAAGTDVHCAYCGVRFALTPDRRCPECGGHLT